MLIIDEPITTVNGESSTSSEQPKLTPAQQRQLEADAQSNQQTSPSSSKHRRKPSILPNLNSEGDFPALGSGPKPTPAKPVSWGAKRSTPSTTSMPSPIPVPHTNNAASFPALNGVNGRGSSTANSSRASTPAPTPRPAMPATKSIPASIVTENVRFKKNQLATPDAKDFSSVCEKVTKYSGVDKISVSRMKVSEIITFMITGKPENVIKARNRLQNEVGVKVVPSSMELT
jgi:hypothetical protein